MVEYVPGYRVFRRTAEPRLRSVPGVTFLFDQKLLPRINPDGRSRSDSFCCPAFILVKFDQVPKLFHSARTGESFSSIELSRLPLKRDVVDKCSWVANYRVPEFLLRDILANTRKRSFSPNDQRALRG
jgi:hypothetical protein